MRYIVLIFTILLTACATNAQANETVSFAGIIPPALNTATLQVVEPTATNTIAPTNTPRPTMDYGNLPITQTAVVLNQQDANANATRVSTIGTEQALYNAAGIATSTQAAIVTGTALAMQTAIVQGQVDAQNRDDERKKHDLEIEQLRAQNKRNNDISIALWIGGVIVSAVFLVLLMLVIYYRIQIIQQRESLDIAQKVNEQAAEDFLNNLHPVQIVAGPKEVYEKEIAVTMAEKAALCQAATDFDGVFSRRKMCPKYFSEDRWDAIEKELLHIGVSGYPYATKPRGNAPSVLTPEGWQWLKLTPPASPRVAFAPISAKNDGETVPTPPHPTGEVV